MPEIPIPGSGFEAGIGIWSFHFDGWAQDKVEVSKVVENNTTWKKLQSLTDDPVKFVRVTPKTPKVTAL